MNPGVLIRKGMIVLIIGFQVLQERVYHSKLHGPVQLSVAARHSVRYVLIREGMMMSKESWGIPTAAG